MVNHNRVTYMITIEQNYDDWPEDVSCSVFHGQFEFSTSNYLALYKDMHKVTDAIYANIDRKVGD